MSPRAHREQGYWIGFYSNENNEPPHVHVKKAEDEAKYWLIPTVRLVNNYGFSTQQLRQIEEILIRNYDALLGRWYDHFSQ